MKKIVFTFHKVYRVGLRIIRWNKCICHWEFNVIWLNYGGGAQIFINFNFMYIYSGMTNIIFVNYYNPHRILKKKIKELFFVNQQIFSTIFGANKIYVKNNDRDFVKSRQTSCKSVIVQHYSGFKKFFISMRFSSWDFTGFFFLMIFNIYN